MLKRLSNSVASPPISYSRARSGFKLAFPMALKISAELSVLSTLAVVGRKKRKASVLPGWTPEAPIAPRSRRLFSQCHFGKPGSSERTYDTLSFG